MQDLLTTFLEVTQKRRGKVPFWQNSEVYMASPEDVIIKKLEYYREGASEKHIRDIQGILSQTTIDEAYLRGWIEQLGLERQFNFC